MPRRSDAGVNRRYWWWLKASYLRECGRSAPGRRQLVGAPSGGTARALGDPPSRNSVPYRYGGLEQQGGDLTVDQRRRRGYMGGASYAADPDYALGVAV